MAKEIIIKMSDEFMEKVMSDYIELVAEFANIEKELLAKLVKENSVEYVFKYAEALDLSPKQKENLKKLRSLTDFSRIFVKKEEPLELNNPESIAQLVIPKLRYEKQEHFQAALINTKFELIKIEEIAIGGLAQVSIEPREVFKGAIEHGASAIILIHNHPSGNISPSRADEDITERLVEAGKILGVKVVDHIIVGGENYYSMVKENTMPGVFSTRKWSDDIGEHKGNYGIEEMQKQENITKAKNAEQITDKDTSQIFKREQLNKIISEKVAEKNIGGGRVL